MSNEYDPKFYIESLKVANFRAMERMDKLEESFNLLYDAVLEIAEATNTLDGKVFTKLEEAHKAFNQYYTFRSCGPIPVPVADLSPVKEINTTISNHEESE